MNKERIFLSFLVAVSHLAGGCGEKPVQGISLIPGENTSTPTSTLVAEKKIAKDSMLEATVNGFTVRVIDSRTNKSSLKEWPDAQKIAERMTKETPNIRAKIAQQMKKAKEFQPELAAWDESFKIVLSDQIIVGGGRVTAYARNFDQIDIDLELVALWSQRDPQHNLDYILAHELAHTWAILSGIGLGSQLEETAEKNLHRFRGLTTTRGEKTTADSCIVHQSQYGETVEQIIAAYGGRFKVEKMFYKEKPNTAGPTTKLGEGWQITLCPK